MAFLNEFVERMFLIFAFIFVTIQLSTFDRFIHKFKMIIKEIIGMENDKFQELVLKHLMNLSEDVTTIKGDVSTLKGDVRRLETRMENEVIDKIRVLFDGYHRHEDRLDRIEQKVDAICEQVGVHDLQIKLIRKQL